MFSKNKIEVSISNPSFIKSACKHCSSKPKYMYFLMQKNYSAKDTFKVRDYCFKTLQRTKFYQIDSKALESVIEERRFKLSWMFDNNLFSLLKLSIPSGKFDKLNDFFMQVLECECGKTSWAYLQSIKPHIKEKKSTHSFSLKDVYSRYDV